MKKIKRKSDHCLNCGEEFVSSTNYCPNCGQQNTNNYQSVRTLLSDFFSNYFSVEARMVKTILPFLFQPGKITIDFIEGRRLKFAHPIRWYLVISLFHFFFFNMVVDVDDEESNRNQQKAIRITGDENFDTIEKVDSLLSLPDSIKTKYDDDWQVNDYEYNVMDAMTQADTFSVQQIYDSLALQDKPFLERTSSLIMIKSLKSNAGDLNGYLLEKVPIIMFFILPLYGLLLKAFFYRKGLYIKHLVHSLNIHSFFFFILTLAWILDLIGFNIEDYVIGIAFLISSVYIIISFHRVYQQGYAMVILKIFGIGMLYIIMASIVMIIGVLVSMLFM
jgi:predicted RNA-binding Zn-ribbon protein involved in translation (DUF1610 family)